MRNKKIITAAAAILIVISGALYFVYDGLTGNHVEIESVIAQSPAEESSTEVSGNAEEGTTEEAGSDAGNESSAADTGAAAVVDGAWTISPESKVYFSVTTSKETVNYEMDKITGSWTINSADPVLTKAEGIVDVTSMDSGNSQRDQHISGAGYLDTAQFPNATFNVTSFEGLPAEWKSGEIYEVSITGDLTVKGITKEVVFTGQTTYDQDSLKLEASTVVTFDDFGMKNPHTVVMDTENNLSVELRLVLNK